MGHAAVVDRLAANQALEALLRSEDFDVYQAGSDVRPSIVAVHPEKGVLALDIVDGDPDAVVNLNRKVSSLRESVPELARINVARKVVDVGADGSTEKVLSYSSAVQTSWLLDLPARKVDAAVQAAIRAAFAPLLTIDVPVRLPLNDPEAHERAVGRIALDAEQSAVAQCDISDVLVVTGPPGSGKTLVLAARATWLADRHPEWRIQILCFNRVLAPYLEALVFGHANISVRTFGKFCSSLGFRVSLDNEEQATLDVARAIRAAREQAPLDALLIDEWQDFIPAWTQLAMACVRPETGGVALAGDPLQALYRDNSFWAELPGRNVEHRALSRPYRSTRQILDVTAAMLTSEGVVGQDSAPHGQPVDLVWAESAAHQGAAVARDVLLLLQSGERQPQDIGVLVTRKFHMGIAARELRLQQIPCRTIYSNQADELDLSEPTVKILTVHSAKGLEFDVVFLVGLEQLPNPDGTADNDRQGRTGYVGATRARDQLVMTYSKDDRVPRAHPTVAQRPATPLGMARRLPGDLTWPN